jgi:MFS family permease
MNRGTGTNRFFKGISLNILLLGIVSFLNDLSSEMIMPTLPMFVTSLGGGSLAIGLLGGIRDSLSSILNVFAGYWSDKTGKRRIFVFSGYLTSSVFKFFLALSKVWPQALVLASAERIGKGLRSAARDAIIAESMDKNRGKGFGIHRTLDTLGAVFGSLAAFFMYQFFNAGFKTIILAAAILSFISLAPVFFVRGSERKPNTVTLKLGFKNLPKALKLFILVSGIFALGNFSYMFFIMRAQQAFTGKSSVAIPLLLYVFFNVFYAVFAIPLGIASDKFGRRRVLALGYICFALVCVGFAFLTSLFWMVILFAFYGISYAAIDGNQRAFISDLALPEIKGTALGTFHTVIGLMALPAGLIAGTLWTGFNPQAVFIYGGATGFSCSLLLFILFDK